MEKVNVGILTRDVLGPVSEGVRTFINDHTGQEEVLEGYVVLEDMHVCPVIRDTRYFCLNPLYMNDSDNNLHLSRGSVGGTVMNMYYNSLEEAVEAYKKESETNQFMSVVTDYKIF